MDAGFHQWIDWALASGGIASTFGSALVVYILVRRDQADNQVKTEISELGKDVVDIQSHLSTVTGYRPRQRTQQG